MPANTAPIFPLTPRFAMVSISTANTNRDGTTGTYGTVLTGATNGTRVDRITVIASSNTTAGMVRLFVYDGSSVTCMIAEVSVSAITVSATVKAFATTLVFDRGLILPNGYVLKASTHNAESFNVIAVAGDY